MKANSILPIRLSFLFFLLTFSSGLYAFELVCPADVTIDCNEDIYDLSIYGNAQYKDYSGWHDAGYPTVEYDLNHCDQGDIIRTWTVYNPYGETTVLLLQRPTLTGHKLDLKFLDVIQIFPLVLCLLVINSLHGMKVLVQ
jgi:hypothetical protein